MVNKTNIPDEHELDSVEVELTDTDTDPAAEEPELEQIEELEDDKIASLKAKIGRLDDEKRVALEQLAVAKADFLNAKKRLEEEKLRGIERQKIKDIEALLPLCDAFRMARANQTAWEAVDEQWRKGVEGIQQNLEGILEAHGVESFDPTGELFDPELHEALSTTESDSDADTIVSTMQLGYRMGEVIIRHAKVVISS